MAVTADASSETLATRRLSREKDPTELFMRWQGSGDTHAREQLVERFTPLARKLARRYSRSSEPFDDLVQVASLGLLKAINRYDVARGNFAAFAVPTILGELRRYFRDSGWAVHVPRQAQERALKVREAQQRLSNEEGRSPTVHQVAQYLELDVEDVLEALQAIHAYEAVSLDAPRPVGDDTEAVLGDSLGGDDARFDDVELESSVAEALRDVSERDRRILHMRFFDELTQAEIAARVGVSQMQVSRIMRKTLDQLRDVVDAPAAAGSES